MIKTNNYEIQCEKAKLTFIDFDHDSIVEKFDLNQDEEYVYLVFIGKNYRLGKKTGVVQRIEDDNTYIDAEFNEVMSILDLFDYSKHLSKEDLKLSGKFVTPHNLKGTIAGGNTSKHTDLYTPYAKKFSKDIDGLIKAFESLNGTKINTGDVGYIVNIFKDISVMIVFYDEDSDFDAEIKILWDENILSYVHYETTFYMVHYLLDVISKFMKNNK